MLETEIKIEMQLEGANDAVTVFSGFVDQQGIEFNERTDNVKFNAFSYDDLASRIPAELITTQYINGNIDGAGMDGLVLPEIPAMYVKDANLPGFVLQPGLHTITYEYNSGTRRAKLNEGAWVNLANGNNTLGNGETAAEDTQRVQVYVVSLTLLPAVDASSEIVVITAGSTLPKHWYQNIAAKKLLRLLYGECGITDITFDTLEMQTFDNQSRILKLDKPPGNLGISDNASALCSDGTYLYAACGVQIYKRDMDTGVYTYIAETPAAAGALAIYRMWYNARNNHLWCLAGGDFSSSVIFYVDLDDNSVSSYLSIGSVTHGHGVELLDYNYTGSSYKYGIIYEKESIGVYFIDAAIMTESALTTTGTIVGDFVAITGDTIYCKIYDAGSSSNGFCKITINGSGNFINAGIVVTGLVDYTVAIMDTNNIVYYYDASGYSVNSHPVESNVVTTITIDLVNTYGFFLHSGIIYWIDVDTENVYAIESRTLSVIGNGVVTQAFCLAWTDRLHGISNSDGYLYQCSNSLVFIVANPALGGMTIRDVINKTLNAFLLVGIISSTKKAYVYRRGDNTGTPLTTGNTLAVTLGEATELIEVNKHFPQADLVRVTNGNKTVTFDGATYNTDVLSDKHVVEINNEFIPDALVKDVAYYAYQFFGLERNLYKISLGCLPLFQYEPFDNCSVTFTGRIQKIASGPIYATELQPDGTMNIEVLL